MEGVEPPTAWFVARYSIQLSYMRELYSLLLKRKMVRMEGVEPPTAWFVARYSIQLSYMRIFYVKKWRRRRDSNPRWEIKPILP